MNELSGKRVLVMGLGRFGGGVGAARFCAERGAEVLVTDMLGRRELAGPIGQLGDLPIRYRLGRHELGDFTSADLIVVNPAVDRRHNRFLGAAREAGAVLSSEIELLIERLPDRQRVIGVTGTAGKSTTTAMIGHIIGRRLGAGRVHIGGNLGGSLLGRLGSIRSDDWVVLELSSFMLEPLDGWSPHVAVVTNISDNHLDRHGTMALYIAAKQRILDHQREADGDVAILGPGCRGRLSARVGRCHALEAVEVFDAPLPLPGRHNRINAALAVMACGCALGVEPAEAARSLSEFRGLPHRLRLVGERDGVRFFDDSKSTTPESAMLAIESFEPGAAHVILGGYDKGADLRPLAHLAAGRCAGVYAIGRTGAAIVRHVERAGGHCPVHDCGDLETAVARARAEAGPGQVVLLSPGCASWDQFEHFEARGRLFSKLALRCDTET